MQLSDFDFDLPEELIALRPVRPRPASRLLVSRGERIEDAHVSDLAGYLDPGDLLVFNNTKVIPARLSGTRRRETTTGSGVAAIEVTLIAKSGETWRALARPAKRLATGDMISFAEGFGAEVIAKGQGGVVTLAFDRSAETLEAALQTHGVMPLPPYIAAKRKADARDIEDYQTVFAEQAGAVAAPTASLHFDTGLLEDLHARGIASTYVTLHVGAGTFLPVKVEKIESHKMHSEWGEITEESVEAIRKALRDGRRVIPVGTTALRLLETAATGRGEIAPWRGDTDIFIRPGYAFRIASGLMTNFHLPKSTLLMLVAALMGKAQIDRIYAHAIARNYRFFSYGDSSLLLP